MNKRDHIQKTERLAIRKLTHGDFETLLAIMGKPEVMYAWEHGFREDDVQGWIERQLMRYTKDGIGYSAVELQENGLPIDQAGKRGFHPSGKPTGHGILWQSHCRLPG